MDAQNNKKLSQNLSDFCKILKIHEKNCKSAKKNNLFHQRENAERLNFAEKKTLSSTSSV